MNKEHVLTRYSEIINDLENADLDDIDSLLCYYNGDAVIINGIPHNPFNEPKTAARLNARYHLLTGKNHPRYISEVPKVIDSLMSEKDSLIKAGAYTPFYFQELQRIKEDIIKESNEIEFIEGDHPLLNFQSILDDLSNATAEEISQQLDYFNGNPVIINGVTHHSFNEPKTAARLNARYRFLTGVDHPRYISEVSKVIDSLMMEKDLLIKAGAYTPFYFQELQKIKEDVTSQNEKMIFFEGNHPLLNFQYILSNLSSSSVDEISQQLDYFNGNSIIINGVSHQPFNDPMAATKLNTRYRELTGVDHPKYISEIQKVIDEYMKEKDNLIRFGIYKPEYFDILDNISKSVETSCENKFFTQEEQNISKKTH